jgi:predicted nucleic acid-binding Zn ribbon protein
MQSTTSPATQASGPTHGCVRCGAPVPLDIALCERCNPLGLSQPASSQAHGTVFLAVALSVVGLALLGRFALSGIGPFTGSIAGVVAAPPGLAITLSVTNEGSSAGSTTCRVFDPADPGLGPDSAFLTSPAVEPGRTTAFSSETAVLGPLVRPLAVECGRP